MSVRKLIKFFSTFSQVPVEIEDVVAQIVEEYKPVDNIILKPVNIPPDALLGVHYRYVQRVGGRLDKVVLIPYSDQATIPMQRVACCKELIHILDRVPFRTKTRRAVTNLVPTLLQPLNVAKLGVSDLGAFKDRLAMYQALAVLFPEEMREEFHEARKQNQADLNFVAKHVSLPVEMVDVMLSDDWLPLASDFADY